MESRVPGWPEPHRSTNQFTEAIPGANDFPLLGWQFHPHRYEACSHRARGEAEEIVEFKHTLSSQHPHLPPVYSTPDMVRLMETAAFQAIQPYCEGDEISVGTAINIEHRAASGVGAKIRAEAIVEAFDGRFYTVRVSAKDDVQEIGRGTVGRAVVSIGKFIEKTAKV